MKSPVTAPSDAPIVVRPFEKGWTLCVSLLGMAILMPALIGYDIQPLTSRDFQFLAFLFALLVIPATVLAWVCARHRIVASREGLLICGAFKSVFAPWSEIGDYELRLPSPEQAGVLVGYVEIGGKWHRLVPMQAAHAALFERISREVEASRVEQGHSASSDPKVWERGDLRENGDWPKTFTYPQEPPRTWGEVAYLFFVHLVGVYAIHQFSGIRTTFNNAAAVWADLPLWGRVSVVVAALLIACLFYAPQWMKLAALRKWQHEHNLKIVADLDGLTFTSGQDERAMGWDEIGSYHFEKSGSWRKPDLYVIENRRERLEFGADISDLHTLRDLVQSRAINATSRSWRSADGDDGQALGGAASVWRDGQIGVGLKTYHYRTRKSLKLLTLCAAPIAVTCCSTLWQVFRGDSIGSLWSDLSTLALLLVALLAAFLTFFSMQVQCEEGGIRQRSLWGERYLPWPEIVKLESNEYCLIVTGQKATLRIFQNLADYESVKAEIQKRTKLDVLVEGMFNSKS